MNGTLKFQLPTDEEIARYAYFLWESEGRIDGRDMDYWLQAKTYLTTTREDEAGLLRNAESPKSSAREQEFVPAARPAVDGTKTSKKRKNGSAQERAYA